MWTCSPSLHENYVEDGVLFCCKILVFLELNLNPALFFKNCFMAGNLWSNSIATCKLLNDSICPAYKESSAGIIYCMLKFRSIYSQWPSRPCLWIDSYVQLVRSSSCSRTISHDMFSLVHWSQAEGLLVVRTSDNRGQCQGHPENL